MLRVIGGPGLARVIDHGPRLIHHEFNDAWGNSSGIQAQYTSRRYSKDSGLAASVLDQCLQVFNLAFPGERSGVAAVATTASIVVIDSEVFAKQFSQLCHAR